MPSITDVINEKYGVAGSNIADALSQVAGYEPGQGIDNIADAIAFVKDYQDLSDWTLSVKAAQTANMPTANTGTNSSDATVAMDGNTIKITLAGEVSDLLDADHGGSWGEHKWLGFGVSTGLESIVGVTFTDDTGAKATLTEADASEASGLGLSAGDFILYIKAEDPKYLAGKKYFYLEKDGYKRTKFAMKVVETKE